MTNWKTAIILYLLSYGIVIIGMYIFMKNKLDILDNTGDCKNTVSISESISNSLVGLLVLGVVFVTVSGTTLYYEGGLANTVLSDRDAMVFMSIMFGVSITTMVLAISARSSDALSDLQNKTDDEVDLIYTIKNALAAIIGLSIPSLIMSLSFATDMITSINYGITTGETDPSFGYEF